MEKSIERATFAPERPKFDGADIRTYLKSFTEENAGAAFNGLVSESSKEIRRFLIGYITERDKLTEALESADNDTERADIERRIRELDSKHNDILRRIKQITDYEIS